MEIIGKYCFYVGSSRGLVLSAPGTKTEPVKLYKDDDLSEITAMIFGNSENELAVGYKSGRVSVFDTIVNKITKLIKTEGTGSVVGIGCCNETYIIGRHSGIINLWTCNGNSTIPLNLRDDGTLNCIEYNKDRGCIGTGGEHNDFKLWDPNTKKCIFKAKSLGHDELNLPILTSIKAISFFPSDNKLSACVTREGHVLLYDDRAQRKPVVKFLEQKASYTTISSANRERQCLVGTTKGYMQLLDVKAGRCLKTFTSFRGSVTGIVCDPVQPIAASTSLDRYLRVHNLGTKELLYEAYMKQNLTKILMKTVIKMESEKSEDAMVPSNDTLDSEYNELFDNMETITEDGHKKKRKSISQNHKMKKCKKKE